MGQARGTITQEELEKYGGAGIMLMNAGDGLESGQLQASGDVNWTLYWNGTGISGIAWNQATVSAINGCLTRVDPTSQWYNHVFTLNDTEALENFLQSLNDPINHVVGYAISDRLLDDYSTGIPYSCILI